MTGDASGGGRPVIRLSRPREAILKSKGIDSSAFNPIVTEQPGSEQASPPAPPTPSPIPSSDPGEGDGGGGEPASESGSATHTPSSARPASAPRSSASRPSSAKIRPPRPGSASTQSSRSVVTIGRQVGRDAKAPYFNVNAVPERHGRTDEWYDVTKASSSTKHVPTPNFGGQCSREARGYSGRVAPEAKTRASEVGNLHIADPRNIGKGATSVLMEKGIGREQRSVGMPRFRSRTTNQADWHDPKQVSSHVPCPKLDGVGERKTIFHRDPPSEKWQDKVYDTNSSVARPKMRSFSIQKALSRKRPSPGMRKHQLGRARELDFALRPNYAQVDRRQSGMEFRRQLARNDQKASTRPPRPLSAQSRPQSRSELASFL